MIDTMITGYAIDKINDFVKLTKGTEDVGLFIISSARSTDTALPIYSLCVLGGALDVKRVAHAGIDRIEKDASTWHVLFQIKECQGQPYAAIYIGI